MSHPPGEEPASGPREDLPPPYGSLYGVPPGTPPPGQGPYGGDAHQDQYRHGQYGRGGYDPRWGYGPTGMPQHPSPYVTGPDTSWALFCYIGTLILGFLAPLIIYFVKKDESAFIRFHAAQALNYTITVVLQLLAGLAVVIPIVVVTESPLALLALVPVFLVHIVSQYVFLILGTIRASQGQYWRIPVWTCFRMVR